MDGVDDWVSLILGTQNNNQVLKFIEMNLIETESVRFFFFFFFGRVYTMPKHLDKVTDIFAYLEASEDWWILSPLNYMCVILQIA